MAVFCCLPSRIVGNGCLDIKVSPKCKNETSCWLNTISHKVQLSTFINYGKIFLPRVLKGICQPAERRPIGSIRLTSQWNLLCLNQKRDMQLIPLAGNIGRTYFLRTLSDIQDLLEPPENAHSCDC